ncbi:MAG: RICIN domain-containing protein [Dehalococcoidia bacterium]
MSIAGFASVDWPVEGADLRVETLEGEKLAEESSATSSLGEFDLNLGSAPSDVRVILTGGTHQGEPFAGSLTLIVLGLDPESPAILYVDPLTTLVTSYFDAYPDAPLAQAESQVKRHLGLQEFDALERLNERSPGLFSSRVFLEAATASGGFDAFIAQRTEETHAGMVRDFGGDFPTSRGIPAPVSALLKSGLASVAQGVGKYAGGQLGSLLLGAIFGAPDNGLDEVRAELQAVRDELAALDSAVSTLQGSVNQVHQRLDVLTYDIAVSDIKAPLNTVDRNFERLLRVARLAGQEGADIASFADHPDVQRMVEGDLVLVDVDNALGAINQNIQGVVGETTLLAAYEQAARSRLTAETRREVYEGLESLFAAVITAQIRAVWMVSEVYVALDRPREAELYLYDFHERMLAPQTEIFLATVERLALSHYGTRWQEFLPDVESQMLAPADRFVADLLGAYEVVQGAETVTADPDRVATSLTARVAFQGAELDPALGTVHFQLTAVAERLFPGLAATVLNDPNNPSFGIARYVLRDVPMRSSGYGAGFSLVPGQTPWTHYLYPERLATPTFLLKPISEETPHQTFNMAAWYPVTEDVRIVNKNSGKALELAGPSLEEGARVIQWDFTGETQQYWDVEELRRSSYGSIVNRYSGKALDLWNTDGDGARLQQWTIPGLDNHQLWVWRRNLAPTGTIQIPIRHFDNPRSSGQVAPNARSGAALSVLDNSPLNGVPAIAVGRGDNNPEVRRSYTWFEFSDTNNPGSGEVMTSSATGKVLEIAGPSQENGGRLVQFPWDGLPNQTWYLRYAGDGWFAIVSRHSGKALDVAEYKTENGGWVHQWGWNGTDNQQWRIEPLEDGTYHVIARHSGNVLDVVESSALDGAQVYQWQWTGADNQRWLLETVD